MRPLEIRHCVDLMKDLGLKIEGTRSQHCEIWECLFDRNVLHIFNHCRSQIR